MPRGVYERKPMTDAQKKHLSDYWKGKKKSREHAENIRLAKLGEKNPMFGVRPSSETLQKRSESLKGIPRTAEWKSKLRATVRKGEKSNFWRGGVATENNKIRHSTEYREWRVAVFERDDYTCQACGKRGGILNADHIKPFAYYPELRFDLSNGRTLCEPCHKRTDTYGNKGKRKEQLHDIVT